MTYASSSMWDPEQRDIIEMDPGAWQLVEAGPGTGKTAVACARVAFLLRRRVSPSNILLISFTRTAVSEVRNRIASLAGSTSAVAAVRVSTVDSEAWRLGAGLLGPDPDRFAQGYDANIDTVLTLLRKGDPDLLEFLERCEHLIVDEAQDLMGRRATLILALLRALSDSCGVTIFADPAQAIYGFTDEEEQASTAAEPLSAMVAQTFPNSFVQRSLKRIHRTDDGALIDLFESTRSITLGDAPGAKRLSDIKECIRQKASSGISKLEDTELGDDHLVLFRRRAEVLMASSVLSSEGVDHRIRMSGLPTAIHPWVGYLFGGWLEPVMGRNRFDSFWSGQAQPTFLSGQEPDTLWRLLIRYAGTSDGTAIDVSVLRRLLAQPRPPLEFCQAECGHTGPILGTIHASKGRESGHVCLMLPPGGAAQEADGKELEEEARVMYVGATRARHGLSVGKGYFLPARYLEGSGRVYRFLDPARGQVQVEFGRERDFEVTSPVDIRFQATTRQAMTLQRALARTAHTSRELGGYASHETRFHHHVVMELAGHAEGALLGTLSQLVKDDLWLIAKQLGQSGEAKGSFKPPERINHLHLHGVRTIVLGQNDPALANLHEPFATTGIFLSPLIKGFSSVYFQHWRKKGRRGAP